MASLRSFLDELPDGELLRGEAIDLDFNPTALVLALEADNRFPVVQFDRPRGFDVPVVANLFADRARIARMAGAKHGEFNAAWSRAIENLVKPEVIASGPAQECVQLGNECDAGLLPLSRHFEQDAGRYLGSGILVCKDPDTGVRNLRA